MERFVVPSGEPEEFVERVRREIEARGFGSIASVRLSGARLEVRFSYLGTSVLVYALSGAGEGFRARLVDQRMSAFHAPFRSGFEDRFDQVLSGLGARPGSE